MDSLGVFFESTVRGLFRVGTNNGVPGYFIALCIAVGFTLVRARTGRSISLRVLRRAIFPKRMFASASARADIAFTIFAFTVPLGWAIVGASSVRPWVATALAAQFGPIQPWIGRVPAIALTTLCLYLGYELGYWIDHYLKHRVEFLWRFHAVHHSAESLSPLTAFRMHPVDSIIFVNILVWVTGIIAGLLDYVLGRTAESFAIDGENALMLLAFMSLSTLQHSHFWISFSGRWGKLFLSPAHHQIHHSTDPAHLNSNLGSTLAIWDRLFGTLFMPTVERQPICFGVTGMERPHNVASAMVMPFVESASSIKRKFAEWARSLTGLGFEKTAQQVLQPPSR